MPGKIACTLHRPTPDHEFRVSVLELKFAKQVGKCSTVIPAKTGIQNFLVFLDSGSR
jgi:hypothetical protein